MPHERRIFISVPPSATEVVASAADAHHLRDVLRLSEGAHLTVADPSTGIEYDAVISALAPEVRVKLIAKLFMSSSEVTPVKSLVFALCKNPVNDLVCEKAAELGVEHIIFWQAERSILSLSPEDRPKKIARWQKIVESAARQSGKRFLAHVDLALTLGDLRQTLHKIAAPGERLLCCSLSESAQALHKIQPLHTPTHMLVGPAGDLTQAEEQSLQELGFELISLGHNLLRAETAAIAGIGMLQAEYHHAML